MPKSLIGKAINYALGQWIYIYRYIDDGGYALDNNIIERDIRPFATARKAWLFANSVPGADSSAFALALGIAGSVSASFIYDGIKAGRPQAEAMHETAMPSEKPGSPQPETAATVH